MGLDENQKVRFSRDVHSQAQVISQWQQQYAQISRGVFKGVGIDLSLDQADFYFEQMNKATYQKGCIPDNSIGLVVALKCDEQMATCGRSVSQGDVVLISGRCGYEFKSAENMKALMISIRKGSELEKHLTNDLLLDLESSPRVLATICEPNLKRLENSFYLSSDANTHSASTSVNLIDVFTDSLYEWRKQTNSTKSHIESYIVNHYWEIIKRAYSIIISQPYEIRSISQLIDELHISRGTLQNATHQTVGMKAAEFLRAIRLNQVLKNMSSGESVTTAATNWGFLHLSHFSREYKKLFGELPSQTLKAKLENLYTKPKHR